MDEETLRKEAVRRYRNGEKPKAIWTSLKRSERWFFKWIQRSQEDREGWYCSRPTSPGHIPWRTPGEIEEIIVSIRLSLYNKGLFCGAQAITWEMQEQGIKPIPSLRTIGRILARHELTHRRTGRYQPKGKNYPDLPADHPGAVHQADRVGPCYLKGPIRFFNLNSVDIATGRCGLEPLTAKGGQGLINGIWAIWGRLGMPLLQQLDNDMAFYGSPAHPRGMGQIIRLCLHHGIEPVFIPLGEPWRNGVVEKFNHHWEQKFYHRIQMYSIKDLKRESLAYEYKHNSKYRYAKLGGKTPLESLKLSGHALRFPMQEIPPHLPIPKPQHGRYHLVRFIRSDGLLDIFSEKFKIPSEAVYEYVTATIDVAQQRLRITLDGQVIDEQSYTMH